jgi:hypothetical protein
MQPLLNDFLELGKPAWVNVREAVQRLLKELVQPEETTKDKAAFLAASLKRRVCTVNPNTLE